MSENRNIWPEHGINMCSCEFIVRHVGSEPNTYVCDFDFFAETMFYLTEKKEDAYHFPSEKSAYYCARMTEPYIIERVVTDCTIPAAGDGAKW